MIRYWISLLAMVLQKSLAVLDELEALKPKVRRQLDEQKKVRTTSQMNQFDGPNSISYASSVNKKASSSYINKQVKTKIKIFAKTKRLFLFENLLLTLYFCLRCRSQFQHLHLH